MAQKASTPTTAPTTSMDKFFCDTAMALREDNVFVLVEVGTEVGWELGEKIKRDFEKFDELTVLFMEGSNEGLRTITWVDVTKLDGFNDPKEEFELNAVVGCGEGTQSGKLMGAMLGDKDITEVGEGILVREESWLLEE